MNEIDVIKGAREILASGRWHKGDLEDGAGNYCIAGALRETAGGKQGWIAEYPMAVRLLVAHLPTPGIAPVDLVCYNDNPDTTLQDMLDLIDKTLADKGAL